MTTKEEIRKVREIGKWEGPEKNRIGEIYKLENHKDIFSCLVVNYPTRMANQAYNTLNCFRGRKVTNACLVNTDDGQKRRLLYKDAFFSFIVCFATVIISVSIMVQCFSPERMQAFATATDITVLPQLYQHVKPSVVYINSLHVYNSTAYRLLESGSGFIYDQQGHIFTNDHVVTGNGTNAIFVTFADGNGAFANITGTDVYSDLAIIQIDPSLAAKENHNLTLGNSSALEIGQQVVAVGAPLGLRSSFSMTYGIVTQLNRPVFESPYNPFPLHGAIQTQTPIEPGNSGGPLLNLDGQVVGVNTAGASRLYQNHTIGTTINFAVPSDILKREADQLISTGTYKHPFTGIVAHDITPLVARELQIPVANAVMVTNVTAGTPADLAGIQRFDIITGVDNKKIRTVEELLDYIDSKSVGQTAIFQVLKSNGNAQNIALKLAERAPPLPTLHQFFSK